ncbi:hypothetical protein CHU95_03220 [Niveispirillum lacus]|uniref:Aldehyde oxidase/xanthine dehydrogenase a/b hammerhead domain-containing protein n=1 Tax=Niveispirillum lacus TaxID=1981099 RepID=A0A255Z7C6_9PROT|nr:molybdopterin cofactor-binding domain-containing protein [Niveispirillum lacus]OYQ36795.1 hypothetical protein CHU95_03220 [Niveispirillum lacus]
MSTQGVMVSRRAVLMGGLVLGFAGPGATAASSSGAAMTSSQALGPWVRVDPDGRITVMINVSEIGQGSSTGVAQVIAEELDADWAGIHTEQAPVQPNYYLILDQYITADSSAIREQFTRLRMAGATARAMLVQAAAQAWKVPTTQCRTEAGHVIHTPTGRRLGYGDVAVAAATLPVPEDVPLKPREEWRLIGTAVPRRDIPAKVDGTAIYGIDYTQPGLLTATIIQCPYFGGTLKSVDEVPALAVAGVRHVVRLPNAVAVVATHFWAVQKGLHALDPAWDLTKATRIGTEALFADLRARAQTDDGEVLSLPSVPPAELKAQAEAGLTSAAKVVDRLYEAPLLSHSPLEPMNCTAAPLADGGMVLWIPTQAQSRVQNGVAKALGLAPARVTVHTLLSGGGFGRRTVDDHAVQAALIARATGSAVKLIWSREEDTRHGIYRPAVVARLRAGIAPDGKLTVLRTTAAGTHEYIPGGLVALTYDIPTICWSHKIETHGIPGGPWRSVGRSHNIFFLDCFLEEVAAEIGKDALALRLELLSAQPRGRSVLTRVADAIGYGRPAPAGRFRGLGYSRGFGSYCAAAVELSVTNKVVTLHRIVGALDCGTVVNPDSVRAQMEGGLLMGLNACMQERDHPGTGRCRTGKF